MNEAAVLLREHGLKVTPQRLAIYTMLRDTKTHPNAETIYKALEPTNPTMSLATVYKTLDSFKNSKLITEINTGDGCAHYDADVMHHNHFICSKCHSISDLSGEFISDMEKNVADELDCDVEYTQVLFFGVCKNCKEAGI